MKKHLKNLLCLALALAMALSLAACGGGDESEKTPGSESSKTEAEHPDFVYTSEFIPIDGDDFSWMNFLTTTADGIYCSVERVVGENIPEGAVKEFEGQFDVYESGLYLLGFDGKLEPLPNYAPIAKPSDEERPFATTFGSPLAMVIASDGDLILAENQGCNWYSGGDENVEFGSDEYWNNMSYEDATYIRRLAPDGSEKSIFKVETPEGSYVDPRSLMEDPEGNVIVSMGDSIVALKADGSTAYEISIEGKYLDRLYKTPEGEVYAMLFGDNGDELCPVDMAAKKFGEPVEKPVYAFDMQPGAGGYDFCYNSGLNLYAFNIGEEPVKLLNWMDADINNDNLNAFAMAEDGSVVGYRRSYNPVDEKSTTELFRMTKQPYDSVPHKEELTLGVQWLDYDFKDTIINYNRTNDKYRIVVKDYSEYNTEDNWDAGRTKMLTEIMSGEMPDILSLSGLPYTQLASKGLIEDLYPYIQADPELKDAEFIENVLKAVEVDGKLCQAVSQFSVITAAGSPKAVGTETGWTYAEFEEALANMPEGCMAFPKHVTRDQILGMCLSMDMELYADWATGECHFDSPEFASLLEFAAGFPAEYEWNDEDMMIDEAELIASGQQMLASTAIYSFDDLQYLAFRFGGFPTFVGYPSASGNGSAFNLGNGYAITKTCSDKDAAWDFLRILLTEEYQDGISYALPTNKGSFDRALKKAMTPEYEKDMDGNYILDENGEKIPVDQGAIVGPDGEEFAITAVTQEQADMLMSLIDSTTKLMDDNAKLLEIVTTEAQPFFEGQKSAQDVAKLIQSKVNIYINEQR